MDFLKNLSLDDKDVKKHQPESIQDRGLFDKLGSVINEVQGSQVPAQPTATSTTHNSKTEMFLGKLGEVLTDQKHPSSTPTATTTAPPAQHSHKDDFIGKISGVLGCDKHSTSTPAPTKDDNGLLGKVGDVLLGKKQEPAKPQGLGDKINGMLGGGAAGEKKEDALDKAIDFVQEHVLKQGPQHNESAVEQMKDKQIASAIRDQYQKFTGKG